MDRRAEIAAKRAKLEQLRQARADRQREAAARRTSDVRNLSASWQSLTSEHTI